MKQNLHMLFSLIGISLVLFTVCGRTLFFFPSTVGGAEWPMFRGNHRHTGFLSLATSAPFSLLWSYEAKGAIVSSPIVTANLVIVTSQDKKIHILNPWTGKRIDRWGFKSGISSTPASAHGRLYVGSEHPRSHLYALDLATGESIWQRNTLDILSSPLAADEAIFFGSADGRINAVTADSGHVLWTFGTGAPVQSSPAFAHDKIFIGSMDNTLYALQASSGTPVWRYTTGGVINSSPALNNGMVYIGSSDSTLYALDASNGEILWTFRTEGAIHASPAVDESTCYIGSYDGNLYALSAMTGDLLWRWKTDSIIKSSPAVSKDAVFVGAHDAHFYVLNKRTGSLLWKYKAERSISSSPALSSVGVFVGCEDGFVYAFGFREVERQGTEP